MRRTRYQQGSVFLDERTDRWYFRWRERIDGKVKRRAVFVGTLRDYPNETRALRAAEPLRAKLNRDATPGEKPSVTVREVAELYTAEEMPQRYATRSAYTNNLQNHILPKWGGRAIASLRPMEVEEWLKGLSFAPKTKTHLRNMLRLLINSAMRRGFIDIARNPMELVRVLGANKRKRPRVLTMAEFSKVLAGIPAEPFRTMVILAQCLGLRSCEVVGLQWGDVDWTDGAIHIRRNVVNGRVGDVKTDRSEATVPMAPAVAELLLNWKRATPFANESDWLFASPFTGGALPYLARGIQQRHIRPAMDNAGLDPDMGWHSFRHTYRTLLSVTGAAMDVQRDLMRHASITTTLDVYGDSLPEPLRAANAAVVKMIPIQ